MTEVKVIASSVTTLLMGCILAIVISVQDDPQIIQGLPVWLQFIIIAILPPVAAWLGGYLKSSPTSAASRGFVGTYRRGEVEDGR
jgi:hypothetical protein